MFHEVQRIQHLQIPYQLHQIICSQCQLIADDIHFCDLSEASAYLANVRGCQHGDFIDSQCLQMLQFGKRINELNIFSRKFDIGQSKVFEGYRSDIACNRNNVRGRFSGEVANFKWTELTTESAEIFDIAIVCAATLIEAYGLDCTKTCLAIDCRMKSLMFRQNINSICANCAWGTRQCPCFSHNQHWERSASLTSVRIVANYQSEPFHRLNSGRAYE